MSAAAGVHLLLGPFLDGSARSLVVTLLVTVTLVVFGAVGFDPVVMALGGRPIVNGAVLVAPLGLFFFGTGVHVAIQRSAWPNPAPFGLFFLAVLAMAYAPYQMWLWQYGFTDGEPYMAPEYTAAGHVFALGICAVVGFRHAVSYALSGAGAPAGDDAHGPLTDISGVDHDVAAALDAAGFESTADVRGASPAELAAVDSITPSLARHLKAAVEGGEQDRSESVDDADEESVDDAEPARTDDMDADTGSDVDDTTDVAERFAARCDDVREAEAVQTDGPVHVYTGRLADVDDAAVLYALSPDADRPAARDAFTSAADRWRGISHNPGVAEVFGTGTAPRPWVAFAAGDASLADAGVSEVDADQRRSLFDDVVEAMRTGARYNLVHGALRPAAVRVLRPADGRPTLAVADWGVTTGVRAAVEEHSVTPYTAPEQVDAPDQSTRVTDVYRLGALAQYLLTNRPPFDAEGTALADAIRTDARTPVADVTDLSPAVDDALSGAMAVDPGERYDTVSAFRDALDRALE
ncbi:MAG: hypothetical protein ABEJ68_05815 [Halobacteriaceae archaeon]